MSKKLSFNERKVKFWLNVKRGSQDECWLWIGGRRPNGYGGTKLDGKSLSAHRAAWIFTNGQIKSSSIGVLHRCDNRLCCNPAHLFLGTNGENNSDRSRKGRSCKGVSHHRAKLNEQQVTEIRSRYKRGNGQSLANEFGISHSTMLSIVRRQIWKQV